MDGFRVYQDHSQRLGLERSLSSTFASVALARVWLVIARCFWLGNMEACPLNSTLPVTAFYQDVDRFA